MNRHLRTLSHLNGFVMCKGSPYVFLGGVHISGTKQSRKLKFSRQTYLSHIKIIFEYCHVSVLLDNVDVLNLEDGNVCSQF